jgi:hypothetical protein
MIVNIWMHLTLGEDVGSNDFRNLKRSTILYILFKLNEPTALSLAKDTRLVQLAKGRKVSTDNSQVGIVEMRVSFLWYYNSWTLQLTQNRLHLANCHRLL